MHSAKQSLIGLSAMALSVLALAAVLLASPTHAHSPATVADDIQLCVQRFRDGISDRHLTREQRRALRLQLRLCIHAAVDHHHNSSVSRSSVGSSMTSGSSSHATSSASSTSHVSSLNSTSHSSVSSVVHVTIEHMKFSPAALVVKKGTTVRWTNKDHAPHTVTGTNGSPLGSGILYDNDTYIYTFSGTGSHTYRCSFHPSMVGSIQVTN